MPYEFQDHYFHRAKKEHYLARAVYKLDEIQKKYKLLRPGNRVLDLGAAPGSWIQLTAGIVGRTGFVFGVDLKPIEHAFPPHVTIRQGDITEAAFQAELREQHAPFDVVLSDMAPSTSGIRVADSARSALLVEQALSIALMVLRPGGHFLVKIFQGSEFHAILADVKKAFEWVKVVKPAASKKQSKEIYILAMRLRGLA